MTKIQYLKTWAMRVVEKPWGIAGAVATGLFFINPILTILFPEVGPLPPDLAWQIPLTILLVFLGPRFFLVPYWMHHELEKQVAETSTSSLSLKTIDIRRTYIAENGTPSGVHKVLLIVKNDSKLAKTIHGIKATVPGEKFGISSITGAYLKPEGFFTFQEVTLHPKEHAAFELCSLHERKNVDTRLSFGCQTNEGGKASWRKVEQPEKQTFPLCITAKDDPGQEWTIEIKISETEISCETVFVGELRKDQNSPLCNSSELFFPNNFIKSHG